MPACSQRYTIWPWLKMWMKFYSLQRSLGQATFTTNAHWTYKAPLDRGLKNSRRDSGRILVSEVRASRTEGTVRQASRSLFLWEQQKESLRLLRFTTLNGIQIRLGAWMVSIEQVYIKVILGMEPPYYNLRYFTWAPFMSQPRHGAFNLNSLLFMAFKFTRQSHAYPRKHHHHQSSFFSRLIKGMDGCFPTT